MLYHWSRTQSAIPGSDRQGPSHTPWNDTEGESVRLWETCHYLTQGLSLVHWLLVLVGWIGDLGETHKKAKLAGNFSSQAGNFGLSWIWLGVMEVWDKEKAIPYSISGTSPEITSYGSPIGVEIHIPGNELACFISPPSHPCTHSFPLFFPPFSSSACEFPQHNSSFSHSSWQIPGIPSTPPTYLPSIGSN